MQGCKTFFILLFLSLRLFGELTVDSEFSPSVVPLGQYAQYKLILSGGGGDPEGEIPSVEGVQINGSPSVSNSVKIINGVHSSTKTYTFRVSAAKIGVYTLPEWKVKVGKQTFMVPAATLKITPPGEEFKGMASLELQSAKSEVYVGETIPALLKLYIRGDVSVSLNGVAFEKNGDAFTASDIDPEFSQKKEVKKGLTYKVAIWPVTLTALKAGKQSIVYSLPILVEVPDNQRRMRHRQLLNQLDSLWGDSFGMNRREKLTVYTSELEFDVMDLPRSEGAESFTGGIGEFDVGVELSTRILEEGEPLTLTLTVKGNGNFDRINPPEILGKDEFKVYPPKSKFEPYEVDAEETNWRGVKTFEYILIPSSSYVKQTPEIVLSFFDPEINRYIQKTIAPMAIEVKTSTTIIDPVLPTLPFATPVHPKVDKGKRYENVLLPIRLNADGWAGDSFLPYKTVFFWLFQLGVFSGLAGFICWQKQRIKHNQDGDYMRHFNANKQVKELLAEIDGYLKDKDLPKFFHAAENIIQHSVGKHFPDKKPESITVVDVEKFLKEKKVDSAHIHNVGRIFEISVRIKFAGARGVKEDGEIWHENLVKFLKELTKLKL